MLKKVFFTLLLASTIVLSCSKEIKLKIATTTSLENSGFLKYFMPYFEKITGITTHVVSTGTGLALKHGEQGNVDLLLVHAKEDELKFVQSGYGIERLEYMFNDFVIIGPSEDPARLKQIKSVKDCFITLEKGKFAFVSRGDDSGTHKKEKQLWNKVGVKPSGSWYKETGSSMESVLLTANELKAYTLTDRSTYLALKEKIKLDILFENDPELLNIYSVILINPAKHPNTNISAAKAFVAFIKTPLAQKLIADYKKNDQQLFYLLKK